MTYIIIYLCLGILTAVWATVRDWLDGHLSLANSPEEAWTDFWFGLAVLGVFMVIWPIGWYSMITDFIWKKESKNEN